jgi:hypothetical protein
MRGTGSWFVLWHSLFISIYTDIILVLTKFSNYLSSTVRYGISFNQGLNGESEIGCYCYPPPHSPALLLFYSVTEPDLFFGLPGPDPLVGGTDPDSDPPMMQKYKQKKFGKKIFLLVSWKPLTKRAGSGVGFWSVNHSCGLRIPGSVPRCKDPEYCFSTTG